MPVASSGILLNATPTPPQELITVVRTDPTYRNQNRATWQPYSGLRQAIVVVNTQKDFIVVAGRNMHEVEERTWQMQENVAFSWLLIAGGTLFASWMSSRE